MTTAITTTVALLTMWQSPTETPTLYGDAAFYRPHLMRQVCEGRGLDISSYDGAVALMSCGDIGRDVWIWGERFLVCDCSRWDHYAMNLERGRIIDLDWETWQRHGLPMDLVPLFISLEPVYKATELPEPF